MTRLQRLALEAYARYKANGLQKPGETYIEDLIRKVSNDAAS